MIYEKFIRVLYVDLASGKIEIRQREDLYAWLGGVGVASKLLEEEMRPDLPPTAPEQPIVFACGAATTVFPVLTKTVAMFVSPLTGELGESYAGGRMALTMFMAGYDAIVVSGKAAKPVYLAINTNDVALKDARQLWAQGSDETGRIIREREPGGGKRSIIRIGRAGENGVSFASVCVDTYRHFGRLGLGAVFGSKMLKAISIIGGRNVPIRNFKEYWKTYQDIYKKCTDTDMMAKYHDLGTPINVEPLSVSGGLPTKNLSSGSFEHAAEISGEKFARQNLVRKLACTGCPVGCIHIGQIRREFDKGFEFEAVSVGYDYELIYSLGSFLGVKTTDEILHLIEVVEELGMDAMSAGVVMGWATEAYAKGLVGIEQTVVPIEFGNAANYAAALRHLAEGTNAFYRDLGRGAAKAAKVYGGEDFAMTIAGNEMPGYHTGYGSLVGAAVGARHSHLCNGGYSIDQSKKEFEINALVDGLFKEEKERCMLNSLVICLFARKVYDRPTIIAALNSIGRPVDDAELTAIAERIYRTKLRIKQKLGFDQNAVKLPKRFFDTVSATGKLDEKVAYEAIRLYSEKTKALLAADQP
jgi:aldehyde:ferredoxin oxidoreductase